MLDSDLNLPIELLSGEGDDDIFELTLAALAESDSDSDHVLPHDFDYLPPGPWLGAILSALDLTRLTGYDVVRVMQAHYRQVSHHQAGVYRSMAETAHAADPDTSERQPVIDNYAIEEIGAALTMTRRMATRQFCLALDAVESVPDVYRALSSGRIDARKAGLITDGTIHLKPEVRREVVDRALTFAPDLTSGQLGARLRRMATEADPEQAQALYELSLSERRVVADPSPEGTATLIIEQCSPTDVYAARDHINRLAKQLKTADESRTIDQLRADVAMRLLTGQINGSDTSSAGTVSIHVDLKTLARLSESPAELAGYGPIVAELARKTVRQQQSGSWVGTVTDPETGEPLHTVTLRRRPTAAQKRKIRALNRTCVHPGCRMPAVDSDIDHIIDYANGGETTVRNTAPLCRRHHMAKHRGGWRYRRIGRIEFEWTSPLGHTYRTGRPP